VLARGTPGFTGADLSNLINLAAIKATIRNQSSVDMKLLEEAKDDIIMGIKRTAIEKNPDELKVTAYHEGGHALVAIYSDGAHPLHKATIIQRGNALGVTVQLPERDEQSFSRKQMMARLAVCMGGRAAEELAFGEQAVTSGASSDLKQATALASNMVKRWGMSDRVGLVYYQDGDSIKNASDTQRAALDDEVKTLLNDSYSRAKTILTQHKHELDLLAKALLEHETLSGDEIKLVIQGKALPSKLVTRPPPSTSSGDQGGGKDTKTAPTPKLEPIARQSV
jgi:ATP-dependent metalloprotease